MVMTSLTVTARERARIHGSSVPLTHAAKYAGQRLGSGSLKGECATGVQVVFHAYGRPLGLTRTWKEGVRVKGSDIKPGTAIATFQNGKYAADHAAIFIEETESGLWVWDQFNRPEKPWGKRILRFTQKNWDRSNNGNLFSVIETT